MPWPWGLAWRYWALLLWANLLGIRTILVYGVLGIVVWLCFSQSGVHATIAGVLIAWTVPARNRIDAVNFQARRANPERFEASQARRAKMLTDETQQHAVIELEEACGGCSAAAKTGALAAFLGAVRDYADLRSGQCRCRLCS